MLSAAAMVSGPPGDDSWQTPARALVALERQRLGLGVDA
jgi:hypothetical protein